MDDLQRIVPDKLHQLGNRKLLLIQGIIILILLVLVVILLAVLGSKHAEESAGHPTAEQLVGNRDATCATPDCLHLSGFLADNMDTSVDPCEDFHRFSCGGYRNRHHLAPDQDEVTMIQSLSDELDERLREMIENPNGGGPRTPSEAKLRDFFLSCVHDYGRMREGGTVLVNLIREKLGGWYVLDPLNWNHDWDLQETIARVQGDLMVNVFFEAYMERDYLTNRNVMAMYPAATGLWYTYYFDDTNGVKDAYQDYMRRVATLLLRDANVTVTPSDEDARVEQFVNDAFGMEFQLASTMQSLRRARLLYDRVTTTLGQIDSNFTQLNWLIVVRRMFEDLEVTESTTVRLVSKSYFAAVNAILQNETEAHIKDRVLNNYMAWRIAHRYSADLSWEYRDASLRFLTALHGELEWQPTWKICLDTVHYRLGTLLATEFIRSHIAPNVKNQISKRDLSQVVMETIEWRQNKRFQVREIPSRHAFYEVEMELVQATMTTCVMIEIKYSDVAISVIVVKELVSGLQSVIGQRILELPWMDNTTQKRAVDKINSAKSMIGYSEMYYNESVMEELHSMLEVDISAGYFRNLLNLNKFQRRMRVRLLLDKETYTLEHLPLLGINLHYWVEPYFLLYYNTLLVPAGAMLDPMYNSRRPQIFNFGFLGTLLAGELLESIGQSGRYTWSNGSYGLWWTNATSVEYQKTTQCFVQYFNGLTVGPFNIEGQNKTVPVSGTIQTRKLMNDLGGIRAAFRAYKEWAKSNGDESLPVGQHLSRDQLFFVASAQTKCYLRTDEEAYRMARMGSIPEDMELNSLLSHMPEFTDAFQCRIGSKMRVSNQCETY